MNKERADAIELGVIGAAGLILGVGATYTTAEFIREIVDPNPERGIVSLAVGMTSFVVGSGLAFSVAEGQDSPLVRDIDAALGNQEKINVKKALKRATRPFVAGLVALTSVVGIPTYSADGQSQRQPIEAAFVDYTNKRNDQSLYEGKDHNRNRGSNKNQPSHTRSKTTARNAG